MFGESSSAVSMQRGNVYIILCFKKISKPSDVFGFDEIVTFAGMQADKRVYACMYICVYVCVSLLAGKHDISKREAWTKLIIGV